MREEAECAEETGGDQERLRVRRIFDLFAISFRTEVNQIDICYCAPPGEELSRSRKL